MASGSDLQPMLEALKSVAVALKEDAVPFALAGGYAVYARGGADSRHDVDFVVREEDVAKARQALESRGIAVLDPPEDWLFKARVDSAQVDVIFR
ncbi:MAG: nucleotidyltransferase domain-containing protein, partial [Actinomycetes bacterium]